MTEQPSFWRFLFSRATPGMGAETPRIHPVPLMLMIAVIILQVVARYQWGFLAGKDWQALHIVMGVVACLGIIGWWHGFGVLKRVRPQTWTVLGIGIGLFVLFWYVGRVDSYRRWFSEVVPASDFSPIYGFIYFAMCATLFRLVFPLILLRWTHGLRPGDLGLSAKSNPHQPPPGPARRIWWLYILLFVGMFPVLVMVSDSPAFMAKYPLSRTMIQDGQIPLENFLVFEFAYIWIFVSGESLWRGILAFGTERDLGLYGLVLMVVPYVTAHFGKPLPETLGAIAAGLTLGFLALKHRSVWWGVALHYGIALSMDLLAMGAQNITLR